jgi:putative transposase
VDKTEQGQLEHPWVYEVPYDLRDEGVKDFVQAHKACKTKVAKGDLAASGFHFKFRTAKDRTEKLVIHRKHWWAAGVFHPSFFGYEPFRSSEPLPDLLDYDTTLVIDRRLRHVDLCLPAPLEVHPQTTELAAARRQHHPKIVAIDPGVRTFATCYDPTDQRIIEWGRNDMSTFYRMAKHADDLQRRFSSEIVGHRRRYRMRRAWVRMFAQVKNWSRDFHYRFAHWLCQNYDVILLPHYDIAGMVRKGSRRIGAKTARAMLTWSPCTFRDRLLHVSRRYPGCSVVPLSEAYTSKTCRACGALHHQLGGNRHFCCPTCGYQVSRDENGACNILLRYLTMLEEEEEEEEREKPPLVPSSPVVCMIDDLDDEDLIGVAENQGDAVPLQIDDQKQDSPECEVVAFHRHMGAFLATAPACMHELAKCNLSQNCELS